MKVVGRGRRRRSRRGREGEEGSVGECKQTDKYFETFEAPLRNIYKYNFLYPLCYLFSYR